MMKYRNTLIHNIKKQLEAWLEQTGPVPHEDLYRFLHSLKGTAGTIGLQDFSDVSHGLLAQMDQMTPKSWHTNEWRPFLMELITLAYEQRPDHELFLSDSVGERENRYDQQPLILILDDDVTLLMYLKEELEKLNWSVIATVHPHKALDYFHDMHPDCLIVDLNIPETGGFQVMKTLGEKIKKQYVPTTVISIDCERDTRFRAYHLGADDFMCKPLDVEELSIRLERQLRRKRWIDRLLFLDELTGAYNRNSLQQTYERLLLEGLRAASPLSLAFLDIDHFKQVNDQYGHLIGDDVLARFANFVQSSAQKNDILFRYGGEEFILLMPQTAQEAAKHCLETMLASFCQVTFHSPNGPFSLSFSAGVVEITAPEKPLPYWLELADDALYTAKKCGRCRIETPEYTQSAEGSTIKLKVAIIDDDAMIRTMLAESVKDCFKGWISADTRVFRDGEAFLQSDWHSGPEPYLIILDGMMPNMDGMDVLQVIRSLPDTKKYTVLMLTGRTEEQDIVKALQLGADDYMTKPFNLRELEARIKRLIRRVV